MNLNDSNVNLDLYLHWRAMGLDPAMIAFKEQVLDMQLMYRQACEMDGYTQAELDAIWEARKPYGNQD